MRMTKIHKRVLTALIAIAVVIAGLGILAPWGGNTSKASNNVNYVKVHFKWESGTPNIYYWNLNGATNNPVGWPGVQMNSEGNGWYEYTVNNASSMNLIFNYQSWQTVDLSRDGGEWWFMDGNWYSSNPEASTGEDLIVHLKTNWTSPKFYYWNVNGTTNNPVQWPGVDMQPEGNNWYTYTLANTKSANIIFSNAGSQQTADLSRTKGEWWYKDNTWHASNPEGEQPTTQKQTEEPTEEPTTPSGSSIIVNFKSNWNGANIYYWNVNGTTNNPVQWPGTAMTAKGNGWYTFTIQGTSANIIFNFGGQQTGDLSRTAGEWWYKNGVWTSTDPEGEQPSTGETEPTTPKETTTRDPNRPTYARTDFRDETIYFVMTTRFYDGDKSNNVACWDDGQAGNPASDPAWRGDFKGLIQKLDYIKALGFTAIWITPVVENISGYDYHGYHAVNHSKVDPRYESSDVTYQDLINAVHAKGMKIIQDVVFNHTGNFGETNLLPIFEKVGDLSTPACLNILPGVALPANYFSLTPGQQYQLRLALMKNTDGQNHDVRNIYHHYGNFNWDEFDSQLAQIAGDCVDLNTENSIVTDYLIDAYTNYIDMGVDAFRVDTVKHISRLTFNMTFNPAFKAAGGDNFFMFGEVCARDRNYWYRNTPPLSSNFYTWKESDPQWANRWSTNPANQAQNIALTEEHFNANRNVYAQPTSNNAILNGNNYHKPDYSMHSGMDVIDFPMHWNFEDARSAFGVAVAGDRTYNDATFNVTYVDSHDYAPDQAPEGQRFARSQDTWAENLNLMFTFRGIPCLYYGSEIEFKKGEPIDVGPNRPLEQTGRAYFGDHIEGSINVTDFAEYNNATGAIAQTLNHPLSLHIQRLNKIRAEIPALRKGQYSTEGVNGDMSYKRRYTNAQEGIDSFVCVSVTDGATFNGVPNGKYVDAITGTVKNVTNGTLQVERTSKGNMRVYVLETAQTPAPGKIGVDGKFLK